MVDMTPVLQIEVMKIDIRFRGLDSSDLLREYVQRRVHSSLGRFAGLVDGVMVRIADVNGPRGGVDKRCQVGLSGAGLGTVNVETRHASAYRGVAVTLDRAARAVRRALGRRARFPRPTQSRGGEAR